MSRTRAASLKELDWEREPDPLAQILEHLEDARERGIAFSTAWREAVSAIAWTGIGAGGKRDWTEALLKTRPAWCRAYEGTADGIELQLDALVVPSDVYEECPERYEPTRAGHAAGYRVGA